MYGSEWNDTFPLIKIFVFVSAVSCLSHPLFTVAYAKGKPKYLFYLSLVTLAVKIPLVFLLGHFWSVTGIAIALLLSEVVTLIVNLSMARSMIGSFLRPFLANIIKPIIFCALMILTVYAYKVFFGYQGIFNTIAQVVIGFSVYLVLTFKFKYTFADVKELKNSL
jgi:PST family polysaccharide transporter/lipopolysaccharide exporter